MMWSGNGNQKGTRIRLHHHCSPCPPQRFWPPRPGARTFRADTYAPPASGDAAGIFFARRDDDDDRVRCNRRGSRNERAEPVGAVQLPGIRPAPDRSAHAPAPGSGCMGYVATGGSARGYGAFGRRGPDRRLIDGRQGRTPRQVLRWEDADVPDLAHMTGCVCSCLIWWRREAVETVHDNPFGFYSTPVRG